ncbi:MAG: thermonuclease family protein [Leptospiraceae bacterium]|nr:thermonuclease family protein [Leptospiraceae bacterium]MCK6379700.1 thermonuclease family protein [Leptospiraceae bacterium]NUM40504.1 thermonuclease family protein [Leptospiraceae bacterium]
MVKIILPLFLISFLSLFSEEILTGKVVGVSDGDTIRLYSKEDNTQYKIRLSGIDAPEKNQTHGRKSKQALSDFIFGKIVEVSVQGEDKYKRILGYIKSENQNINLEMVKTGNAWVYRKYNRSKEYIEAERIAKDKKIGLWNLEDPIPPWEFRKEKKKSKKKKWIFHF